MPYMDGMTNRELCRALVKAESESEAIHILKDSGLWSDLDCWTPLGDIDNNYGTIINQQASAEAALAEKITNSIDARLMAECRRVGHDPQASLMRDGTEMPTSPHDAVDTFGCHWKHVGERADGLTPHAQKITVVVTGRKRPHPACVSVVDQGEGQTPDAFPDTFCSIYRSNKNKVKFAQGRYNMGGTGTLRFCGDHGVQLIVSRRDPAIGDDPAWGFTVFRKLPPAHDERNPYWAYLVAPVDGRDGTPPGQILRFAADRVKLLPKGAADGGQQQPWTVPVDHGTLVKLYDFIKIGSASDTRPSGQAMSMTARLEVELADPALPFRVHECRYTDSRGNTAVNCVGLVNRYAARRSQKTLEDSFPFTAKLTSPSSVKPSGQQFSVAVYAFKQGEDGRARGGERRRAEHAVAFTVNGQLHAGWHSRFFRRKGVDLSLLADDLLVVVDCSKLSDEGIRQLFTGGRDRMIDDSQLRSWLEKELEEVLSTDQRLRSLHHTRLDARRKSERGKRAKAAAEIVQKLLAANKSLAEYLAGGVLPSGEGPVGPGPVSEPREFIGNDPPTFFKLRGKDRLNAQVSKSYSVAFTTDAVNGYFDQGQHLLTLDKQSTPLIREYLHDGRASIRFEMPESAVAGDHISARLESSGPGLLAPFVNEFTVVAIDQRETNPGPEVNPDPPAGFDLPDAQEVRKRDWKREEFTEWTGARLIPDADPSQNLWQWNYDHPFLVEVRNRPEAREKPQVQEVLNERFKNSMLVVGLSALSAHAAAQDAAKKSIDGESAALLDPADWVAVATDALAPVVFSVIEFGEAITEVHLEAGD